MGKRIPPDKVQKIIELYKQGYQISEIARRLGIHRQTVSKYIKISSLENLEKLNNNIYNKRLSTAEPYSMLIEILGRNIDEEEMEDYEKIREFTIFDEKDAKLLKKYGFEVEERKSKFGKHFIVKIPLGLVHLISEISYNNLMELEPLDDIHKIVDEIKDIGKFKMENCIHNNHGFCMMWYYAEKPSYGKNGVDYLEKDGRYYIKANPITCALCPYYKEKGKK